jgi:putative oxidoreductase
MNAELLVLRFFLGLLLTAHGIQKLTRHLDGEGLAGSIKELADDGFRGGLPTALGAGVTEVGAGLLMVAGLLTPIASSGIIGVMLVAASTKLGHGPWVQHDGYEYPLLLAILAGVLAWTGPGAWSLDKVAGFTPWPVGVSVVVTGVGIVSAIGTRLALRRPATPRHQSVTAK